MPEFKVPMAKVVLTNQEKLAVLGCLDRGQLSPGKQVSDFEKAFSSYMGGTEGIMVNSGTDALRIALLAMKEMHGWSDGDEVIVPALTFVATVNVVLQAGLKPVFADVWKRDLCINPNALESLINDRTRAILPVHLFGQRAAMGPIMQFADLFRLDVLEDSCESVSAKLAGNVSCFSFYVAHLLNLGVGGMAVTSSASLARLMRSYANHGRDPQFLGSQLSPAPKSLLSRFTFERIGYSSRVTEMQAAMGLVQLGLLPDRIVRRRDAAFGLFQELSCLRDSFDFFDPAYSKDHSWMMFPVVIHDPLINRDEFCALLEADGIETRPLFPLLDLPLYRSLFPGEAEACPVALNASRRGFYLPCNDEMTDDDIHCVQEAFWKALKKSKEVAHV